MSSSSEFSDSGRFSSGQRSARAPEKSNFAQTCNLLSQYLKENGTLGDLNLGMTCTFEANGGIGTAEAAFRQTGTKTATTTMNLFPVMEKSGEMTGNTASMPRNLSLFPQLPAFRSNKIDCSMNKKSETESSAQMTIFYGGQVIVFNDLPADKAKEVMLLASKTGYHNQNSFPSSLVQKPIESANSTPSTPPNVVIPNILNTNLIQDRPPHPQPNVTALPIARKVSLTRFLEKRKDRITARAPYQTTSNSTATPPKPAESKSWLGLAAQSPLQFQHQL